MTAEEVIPLFEQCARPYLDMCFQPNTCIEQTRVFVEVLKRFGVSAEPFATKLHITVPSREYQYFASGDPADLERARKISKNCIEKLNDKGQNLGYHTVSLVERRIFVDLTTAQASSEQFKFHLKPSIVWFPLNGVLADEDLPDITAEASNDDGVPFTVRWIGVKERDWEDTDAWEPSHLWKLIDLIEGAMWNERLAQTKANAH